MGHSPFSSALLCATFFWIFPFEPFAGPGHRPGPLLYPYGLPHKEDRPQLFAWGRFDVSSHFPDSRVQAVMGQVTLAVNRLMAMSSMRLDMCCTYFPNAVTKPPWPCKLLEESLQLH